MDGPPHPHPTRRRIRRRPDGARSAGPLVTTVHGRGAAPLDAMLALSEIASRAAPIDEVLAELARRTAGLLGVDVCSIYLREADVPGGRRSAGELVLRATFGLPERAVGAVRMRVGEGLTGFAVECLRPVSVAAVTSDARNKRFDGLGEERFPALCALPLVDGARAVGALVVQRRQPRAFGPREVVLVAAMAPPILLALERARAHAERTRIHEAPRVGPRPEEIALRGASAAPGRALGTVAVRRARRPPTGGPGAAIDPAAEQARLGRALAEVAAEVAALDAWARPRLAAAGAPRALGGALAALLEDARLRGRAMRHVEAGATSEQALDRVARDYVRGLGGAPDEALRDRALELEALVARLLDRLDAPGAPALAPGRLLVAHRLTVCEAVELAMRHGVGAALAGPAAASPGAQVARALGLPVVCDLAALFQWAADGDRALIDGDAGQLILNPSRADEAAFRRSAPRP